MAKYDVNRDGECFLSSLANAILVEFDDNKTAAKVYEEGRKHNLVQINVGTIATTWPNLVRELSEGKYIGELYCHPDYSSNTLEFVTERFTREQLAIYNKVIEQQNIHIGTFFEIDEPVILALKKTETGHAIVDLGDNKYIDNGIEKTINLDSDEIKAVFKVKINKD